ncbi:DUF5615 family PIN-like protein [Wenzhouxiangella sp. AB-CW3]|uniref:DUF5615 family PIN-like protein n=1 Tax=Wenzhouxiangella sp. AB-CW3 TaxID=2771012 RepID=UPI00168A713C|nr:DUF5615 family PIN-like protein [Wenzhouxiangella sp. AB-CW3]QOC21605.1 DUF5615 family PIN-like protein [Wenzhouxiangella sp. AB-CW3]
MRFLLDQGVPATAAELLNGHGLYASHVSALGMSTAADARILDYARTHELTVVTLDADFHTLLALSQEATPSVIRVRQQGLNAQGFTKLLVNIIPKTAKAMENGAAITVTETQVRIRHLPILSEQGSS